MQDWQSVVADYFPTAIRSEIGLPTRAGYQRLCLPLCKGGVIVHVFDCTNALSTMLHCRSIVRPQMVERRV